MINFCRMSQAWRINNKGRTGHQNAGIQCARLQVTDGGATAKAGTCCAVRDNWLPSSYARGTSLPSAASSAFLKKPMICSSLNRFFPSNLLSFGIGLQVHLLLKSGGRRCHRGRHSMCREPMQHPLPCRPPTASPWSAAMH